MNAEKRLKTIIKLSIIKDTVIILAVLFVIAFITGKYIEAVFFCVAHWYIRERFNKQFHLSNPLHCLLLTCVVAILGIIFILPLSVSIISAIPLVIGMSWVGCIAAERKEYRKELVLIESRINPKRDDLRPYRSRKMFIKELLGTVNEENIRTVCERNGVDKSWQNIFVRLYVDKDKLCNVAIDSMYTEPYFNILLDEQLNKLLLNNKHK